MSSMINVAIVFPNDQSAFIFGKGLLRGFKDNSEVKNVYVISDIFGENTNGYYAKIVESWGVKHIPLKMARFISPLEDIRYLFGLYRILRRNRINVVINAATKPNIYGPIAAKLAGVDRVLCSVWGRGRIFTQRDGLKGKLLRFVLLKLYRLACALSTKVWFTNKSDLDYFVEHRIVSINQTILTKNFVDIDDYSPMKLPEETHSRLKRELELRDEDQVVIMVGRMLWAKGVREFVDAAKLLKDSLPKVKFILVGPKEKDSLDTVPQSYLQKNGKSENFLWPGFRTDMKDLYALSEIAVLPSYYKEGGYPRALIEPMAMGRPVIAADTPDCRGPVEHGRNGFLVPIKDPTALAGAISILMKDDLKRKEFGSYSRIKAKAEYDETVISQQVLGEFCPSLMGHGRQN